MRPIRTILALGAAGAIAVAAPTLAAGFHDLSSIDRAVERFTGAPLGSRPMGSVALSSAPMGGAPMCSLAGGSPGLLASSCIELR